MSWVDSEVRWVVRRVAPCWAYWVDREVRFWKAERPTPRRVDISVMFLEGEGCGLELIGMITVRLCVSCEE